MASEPSLERLRLLIESEDEEDFDPIKDPPPIGALQRRPEDMMDEHRENSDGSRRFGMRRALPIGLALLALVSFGAIVWEAYTWGTGTGDVREIPVIHADSEPIKTRPAEPGGLAVPHQDKLVLNEITPDSAQPQIERLLPPPEVPRPPPPAPAATVELPASTLTPAGNQPDEESATPAERSGDGEPQVAEAQPAPSQTGEAAGTTAAETEANAAAPQEPVVAADPTPSPPTEVAVIPPAPVAPAPDEAPPVAKEAPKAEATAKPEPAKPEAAAKPEPAKPQTAAVPATGGFLVQLGALKTRASADREWGRLAKAFPQLLGDRTSRIQAVDVAGKGKFHRVQAGYFADRASAAALCARLKAQKQDCIVVRR